MCCRWGCIKNAISKNSQLTCRQLKLQLPKTLSNVGTRTIRRIICEELYIPSRVAADKPFVTEKMIGDRLTWARAQSKRRKKSWENFLFADEKMWPTKPTTSRRRVRRPRGAFQFDPKFTNQTVKYPEQILIWGGISEGVLLVTMNSERYVSILGLTLVHE